MTKKGEERQGWKERNEGSERRYVVKGKGEKAREEEEKENEDKKKRRKSCGENGGVRNNEKGEKMREGEIVEKIKENRKSEGRREGEEEGI